MHPMLNDYFEKKAREKQAQRDELLIRLGLFEKEFSDNTAVSAEYPECEWDHGTQTGRWYRKKAIAVSDGEYAEILELEKSGGIPEKNKIAAVLKVIAWIVFCGGAVLGIVAAFVLTFGAACICWGSCFVSGMLFLGFSAVIQLLTDIKNK